MRALVRALTAGADGDSVLWFPDRSSFLARYFLDCANGRAHGRWEYDEFEGKTLGHVVASEPEDSLHALRDQTSSDRRAILGAFTSSDARIALDALAACERGGSEPVRAVAAAARRILERTVLPDDPAVAALALFVETAEDELPSGAASRAREVADLLAVVRTLPPADVQRVLRAVGDGNWRAIDAGDLSRLTAVVAWPPESREDLVAALLPEASPPEVNGTYATHLGGMFLLLPLLDEFAWRAATATWPSADSVDAGRVVQYLAMIGALGADRNAYAPLDPVLRLALGIPPSVDAAALSAWSAGIPVDAVDAAHAAFVHGLRRLGKVSGTVTITPLRDGVVAVDNARGIWLRTAPAAPSSIAALCASLPNDFVTVGTDAWIEACLDGAGAQPAEPIDAHLLARLGEQVAHATVGSPFDLAPHVREFVTVAAQALARELAWRLPGFARSTLMYLAANFLAFDATVSEEPERFVVAVDDPPLHLVLSLTGMNRRRFVLPATGTREWVLTQAH